jgi:ankyrin repeat protein
MNPLSSTTAALFVLAAMLAATGCKSTADGSKTQVPAPVASQVANTSTEGTKSDHPVPRPCHGDMHRICQVRDAARDGNLAKLKVLLQGNPDLVSCGCDGGTQLIVAAEVGRTDVVEFLLAAGADINGRDNERETALDDAVVHHHKNVVKQLLDGGAEVNTRDVDDNTPLMYAAQWGDTDVVEWLLANKADVNARTREGGYTPLYFAAYLNQMGVAELLLSHGADMNTESVIPPLHAASYGSKPMVELLLAHGADVNLRDTQGKTPLASAEEHGQNGIAALLRQHGGHK